MTLTIHDLSMRVGVAPNTIERWIKQGKLSVHQKNGAYQFRMKDIQKWAFKHQIKLNLSDDAPKSPETETPDWSLASAIKNGGLFLDVPGKDPQDVIANCIHDVKAIPEDFKEDLIERLIERESAMSTGIGGGVAIPHPREPLSYLSEPVITIAYLQHPIDYNALDNKNVAVLIFLLSPSLPAHLQLLSSLSYCLRRGSFLNFLLSRPDPEDLIERIGLTENEDAIERQGEGF